MKITSLTGRKACLNSHVFNWLFKTPSEGASRISFGRVFHSWGATAEKAQFLVFSFRASLSVRPLRMMENGKTLKHWKSLLLLQNEMEDWFSLVPPLSCTPKAICSRRFLQSSEQNFKGQSEVQRKGGICQKSPLSSLRATFEWSSIHKYSQSKPLYMIPWL